MIKKFRSLPCSVEAFPAEEVGVEHLLREVKNLSLETMEEDVHQKILSLKGLIGKIAKVVSYLDKLDAGSLRVNNEIIYNLQEILNLMPRITDPEKIRAFHTKTNDNFFTVYVSSIVKYITLTQGRSIASQPDKQQDADQTERPETSQRCRHRQRRKRQEREGRCCCQGFEERGRRQRKSKEVINTTKFAKKLLLHSK